MKWIKSLLIASALVVGMSAIGAAQEGSYPGWQNQDRDHDWDRDRDRDRDRDHDRDWRRAYPYYGHDGDHDADDGYGRGYRRYGVDPLGAAREFGFQDGLNDGRNDRYSGRGFRLTRDGNYKHADRGYIHAYGDKNQYKAWYRQAYERGYQQGYGTWRWGR